MTNILFFKKTYCLFNVLITNLIAHIKINRSFFGASTKKCFILSQPFLTHKKTCQKNPVDSFYTFTWTNFMVFLDDLLIIS